MKKWVKKLILLTIICAVVAVIIINKPTETANYRTTTVKRGNIETIVSGTGSLVASKEKKAYSKINGEISEVFYDVGDNVEVGYPIIKLDSTTYDSNIKAQEIAIKQSELSKQNIEKQIKDLKIVAQNEGYVSGLAITEGTYVTTNMAICNVVKDNKYEIVLQFPYYENNPIILGTFANVTLVDSFSYLTGIVTKTSDMRKLIEGNAQVIDVTIEVETEGYSLDGAAARGEVSNGITVLQSSNIGNFKKISSNIIRAKSTGTVKEMYVNEGKKVNVGDVIAVLENTDLDTSLKNINLSLENLNNQLQLMKNNLKDYTISAPISGTITVQNVEEGDLVAAGTLLTSIANKEVMEFIVPIDELDIAKINYDKEVRITIDALEETFETPLIGKIIEIPQEGVTTSGVTDYYITIEIQGNDAMKISMNANADIIVNSVKDVLYVPLDAVVKEDGKRYVDVLLEDGITVERREVIVGASDISNIEIKTGLNEKETIIIPEIKTGISIF